MKVGADASRQERASGGAVWQTRLSQETAELYEHDLVVLGMDRSAALRRGLQLVHTEAQEIQMEREYAEFYGDERAPLSAVSAALYSQPDAMRE